MARRATKKREAVSRGTTPRRAIQQAPSLPGRRTELTVAIGQEIADRVANCATFKDACLLSGVQERVGFLWIQKGEAAIRMGGPTDTAGVLYVQFVQQIDQAKARRRTLLKLQMRRAASGTEKKPGDWRAAHALGSITDAEEFVIEQRVKFSMEREEALDRLEEAFANAAETLTRDQALDLALLAIAGRVRLSTPREESSESPRRDDSVSGEAVHAALSVTATDGGVGG